MGSEMCIRDRGKLMMNYRDVLLSQEGWTSHPRKQTSNKGQNCPDLDGRWCRIHKDVEMQHHYIRSSKRSCCILCVFSRVVIFFKISSNQNITSEFNRKVLGYLKASICTLSISEVNASNFWISKWFFHDTEIFFPNIFWK